MHTSTTMRHWMHHFHDGSVKAARYTGHLLHEKSFWGIVVILTLIAGVLTLMALFGSGAVLQNYSMPYGLYY